MVEKVVIVGGGTAGWMTATYLRAAFGDRLDVTLVESGRVATIGVGEATFSTVRRFFDFVGLAEHEWMPACQATYKLGIRFEDWREPGHVFYHPFERLRSADGFTLAQWWLELGEGPFDDECFVLPALIDAYRAPKYLSGELFEKSLDDGGVPNARLTMSQQDTQFPYAYHFDASLLAEFLAELGVKRGIRRVVDDVVSVEQDERGEISTVRTREHGDLTGDLFIDCTGFRSLLINQVSDEPFESYQQYLPNNRAVALRVPASDDQGSLRPCTTATATDTGWIWTIPLHHRVGTGHVYFDEFASPEEAEQALRTFVGPAADGAEANHIRMRVGRQAKAWARNCVAIGLSSGFVEPLESTGIFFIQYGIEQLVEQWPGSAENAEVRDAKRAAYNRSMAWCLDGVRDFLVLHYRCAARVDTPFWKATKERELPPGLAERMDSWRVALPDASTIYPHYHGFEAYSYNVMLLGLGGWLPERADPALERADDRRAREEFAAVRELRKQLRATLPTQREYLATLR